MFKYMYDFNDVETIKVAIYCYNGMIDSLKYYRLEKIKPEQYEGYTQAVYLNNELEYIADICASVLDENTRTIERTELPFWDDENNVLKCIAELQKILRVTKSLFYNGDTWSYRD